MLDSHLSVFAARVFYTMRFPRFSHTVNVLRDEMRGGGTQNEWQLHVSPKSSTIWLQVVASSGTDAIPAATCIVVKLTLGCNEDVVPHHYFFRVCGVVHKN